MFRLFSRPRIKQFLVGIIFSFLFQPTFAEDTEVFTNGIPTPDSNMLVVLDNSGSMNEFIEGSTQTRMVALTEAVEDFISNPKLKGINIGLMGFSNGDSEPRPHGISIPVKPIDAKILPILKSNLVPRYLSTGSNFGFFDLSDDNLPEPTSRQTVRTYLPTVIGAWEASGVTPIVDALHEAALYFRGQPPKWGAASAEQNNAAHPSSYDGQYISSVLNIPTGNAQLCDNEDCGLNCRPVIENGECLQNQTSCGTGNNCFTQPEREQVRCTRRSASACMKFNPFFESCKQETETICRNICNGPKGLESGICLGDRVETCKARDYFLCEQTRDTTYCDQRKFQCDGVESKKINSGSATYISPITDRCQSNTLILLTDGAPNVRGARRKANETRSQIKSLIKSTVKCAPVEGQVLPATTNNTLADGRCGAELVRYLANEDQTPSVDGDNTIKTYTIGFAVDNRPNAKAYLQSLADNGDGKYFSANNSAALSEAFTSIANDVKSADRSFAAPVYTVDPSSLLAHSKDIYLPLFKNTELPAWSGNLKKFKLNDEGVIVDASGDAAFSDSGQLRPDAIDFWMPSGEVGDINDDAITSGGFANNLVPSTRKLLTERGSSLIPISSRNVSKLQLGNSKMNTAVQDKLINYIQGYAEDGSARLEIGDILHSKPTLISYSGKQVLFFGTNEGMLHAVDAADASEGGGVEKFAFMPSDLLKNIQGLYENAPRGEAELDRIYGVDGSITAHISDKNKNGKVDTSDGDKATIVFGLRRGGKEYYSLDVTNPDSPKLKWIFSQPNAGESWSKPSPAKLKYLKSGSVVLADVLVFGGGYDNRLDEENLGARTRLRKTKGNSIYIVDAETGQLIWSYNNGRLKNSIPSDISSLDIDGDGAIDRLYFGDTGGNIWRVDLNAHENKPGHKLYDIANNAQLFKFANLGGSGDKRKFFFKPDVSLFKEGGKERLILSIGSGYRSHPLNKRIRDHFYVLSDEDVRNVPLPSKRALRRRDLASTDKLNGESFLLNHKGWYKTLTKGSGEKVLASSLTFTGKVVFTTFAVSNGGATLNENGCPIASGNIASAYALDLLTGAATADLDGDGVVNANDESIVVPNGDILDTPQLVFNKPSNCTNDGCNHVVDIRIGKKSTPLIDQYTVNGNTDLGEFLPKVFWIKK